MNDVRKIKPDTMTLAMLKPRVGERIQLQSGAQSGRLNCTLLGYKEGVSLIVGLPADSALPPSVREGDRFAVRLICGNHIAAFSGRVLSLYTKPFLHLHLEYPQQLEIKRIRRHSRVPVNLRVSLDAYDEAEAVAGAWPCNGFCTDISLMGACVETTTPLGLAGDKLYLTLRLQVAGLDQVLLAPVVVRNQTQVEAVPIAVHRHGVEFFDLDEDSRLILTSFVYQQFLVETGNIDEIE